MRRLQIAVIVRARPEVCRDGYTAFYARVPRLFADLELARGDGRLARLFCALVKVEAGRYPGWWDAGAAGVTRPRGACRESYAPGACCMTVSAPQSLTFLGNFRAF
jgi:hypothetical protein